MKADAIGLLMHIDTVIYKLIDYVYDIFNALAKTNIFDAQDYKTIVSRIYVILGMIMLFSLAYSLLKAVINPDEFAKGENSFPKLIKDVVVSLAIIAVLPSAFTLAFNIQNTVLNQDTIPKLILGTSDSESVKKQKPGERMAYNILSAFLHPNVEWCEKKGYAIDNDESGDINLSTCAENINGDGGLFFTDGENLKSVTGKFKNNEYTISTFAGFGESAAAGKISYDAFVSTIAGVFVLYVLLNFCFDMAVRVVKLMFFQIIAPIPVICRVIPGGKLKDVFSDWMKKTISTYIEVFIRIAIIYLGVFMISQVTNNFQNIPLPGLTATQRLAAKALIIMGVVIFMRQAPKLIGDMFHLDSGSMKLGLMDKLAMGGALAAASTVGGAGGMLLKNGAGAIKNVRNAKGLGNKVGAAIRGIGSTVAGTASGATRGFRAGRGAKNFKDVKNSSNTAIAGALAAKAKRANYRAQHKTDAYGNAFSNYVGTTANVLGGHIFDVASNVGAFLGINNPQDLIDENKKIDDISAKKKAIRTAAENLIIGESNKEGVAKNFGIKGEAMIGNGDRQRAVAFNTATLRSMRQEMENAKARGDENAAVYQNEYDAYLKKFTDAVQNQALLGSKSFNTLLSEMDTNDATVLKADLGEVRSAANEFRSVIKENLTAEYVINAGFKAEDIQNDKDMHLKDPAMDALGDILKIAKQDNIEKINEMQKRENSNKDN